MNFSDSIKEKARESGFLECAIIPSGFLVEEQVHLKNWLEQGMHGEMGYMERNQDKRLDPGLLVENAKTIIVLLMNYFPKNTQTGHRAPVISKYAFGTDYHFVMKDKLRKLLEYIQKSIVPCKGRTFVDSAPVLERAWARKAGLGWVGKHSNLISLVHGSFFFIGELVIDIELPYDNRPEVHDHCGTCTRCIDACPTKAIVANRVVDARKCISYQTIELKGNLDPALRGKFEDRAFGCDICQDVCPWNLKAKPHSEQYLDPTAGLLEMKREDWFGISPSRFNELFRKSAVKRSGYQGLMRNLKFLNNE